MDVRTAAPRFRISLFRHGFLAGLAARARGVFGLLTRRGRSRLTNNYALSVNRPKRALKSFTSRPRPEFICSKRASAAGRRRRKMSAVARPTFVVVASLLANRATANNDDDDDESNEHLSYAVWIALGLFIILFLLFDLLRTRMWWVYEPRLHHDSYRARTPHAPDRGAEASCWALRRSNF